jgi:hypothetical protein
MVEIAFVKKMWITFYLERVKSESYYNQEFDFLEPKTRKLWIRLSTILFFSTVKSFLLQCHIFLRSELLQWAVAFRDPQLTIGIIFMVSRDCVRVELQLLLSETSIPQNIQTSHIHPKNRTQAFAVRLVTTKPKKVKRISRTCADNCYENFLFSI